MKIACIFVISLLIAVAQAQSFARAGARHLGARGPIGGFGPIGARGVGVGVVGAGPIRGVGVGVVAPARAMGLIVPPVMPVLPIAPTVGAGFGAPMVGRIGFGMPVAAVPVAAVPVFPRAGFVVARPRVLVGRSVPEDFKLSFLAKSSQLELSFGVQRVACDVELRQVKSLASESVFSLTSLESSLVDFQFVDIATKKAMPVSVYWDESINKPGLLVKSKVCFNAIFDTIKNEFKRAQFGMVVVA